MSRELLPMRREALNLDFIYPPNQEANGQRFTATIGFYPDGRVGELFLQTGKAGVAMEYIAIDLAVVTSIALQYGAPLDTIKGALAQHSNGGPGSPLGVLVKEIEKIQKERAAPTST